jgi:hypothetical protein
MSGNTAAQIWSAVLFSIKCGKFIVNNNVHSITNVCSWLECLTIKTEMPLYDSTRKLTYRAKENTHINASINLQMG